MITRPPMANRAHRIRSLVVRMPIMAPTNTQAMDTPAGVIPSAQDGIRWGSRSMLASMASVPR